MKKVVTTALVIVFGAMWAAAAPAADVQDRGQSTGTTVKDKAESTGSTIKDKAVEAKDAVAEKATSLKDKISAKLHHRESTTASGSAMDVRDVQKDLASRGYNPGPADGKMGPKTQAAIASFQRDHGLKATGRVDTRTASLLREPGTGTASSSSGSASASPRTEKK